MENPIGSPVNTPRDQIGGNSTTAVSVLPTIVSVGPVAIPVSTPSVPSR